MVFADKLSQNSDFVFQMSLEVKAVLLAETDVAEVIIESLLGYIYMLGSFFKCLFVFLIDFAPVGYFLQNLPNGAIIDAFFPHFSIALGLQLTGLLAKAYMQFTLINKFLAKQQLVLEGVGAGIQEEACGGLIAEKLNRGVQVHIVPEKRVQCMTNIQLTCLVVIGDTDSRPNLAWELDCHFLNKNDLLERSTCGVHPSNIDLFINMNTQERRQAFSKFLAFLQSPRDRKGAPPSSVLSNIDEDRLPKLETVPHLLSYHKQIASTISQTYLDVESVLVEANQLKNKKKNVQAMLDLMTAIQTAKQLSYGLGEDAETISKNLSIYYQIKGKVHYADKYIQKIQASILILEQRFSSEFQSQLSKNQSKDLSEVCKVLQLIRRNSGKPLNIQENITNFYLSLAKKEFLKIEDELFAIPIVGNTREPEYIFFELLKNTLKVVVSLVGQFKQNILKVCGQEGLHQIIVRVYEAVVEKLVLEILMRQKKYYEMEKISLASNKFTIKEKDFQVLQNYFAEFNAMWNQIERLRLHLLSEMSPKYPRLKELSTHLDAIVNNTSYAQINTSNILYMQALLRFQFDKLLKKSPFLNLVCQLDPPYFKQLAASRDSFLQNTETHDFLEDTCNLFVKGILKSFETLNMLIVSAVINFTNHSLINEDLFYAFNQLFNRCFTKLPSNDIKPLFGIILVLNGVAAIPHALSSFIGIKIPQELNEARVKGELGELVTNNQDKAQQFAKTLAIRVVESEWFRQQLVNGYDKALQKWSALEKSTFEWFTQCVSKEHARIILKNEFKKKYTHAATIHFEKQVRSIVAFYERHSHSILPLFRKVFEGIEILQMEREDQVMRFVNSSSQGRWVEREARAIWGMRT